jgi:hypothetical protein
MEARGEGVGACVDVAWESWADDEETDADEPARATGASKADIKMIRDAYVLSR